jgi:hypothetical protein
MKARSTPDPVGKEHGQRRLNIMLNAAPGEIIAYTDNDAFFYQGWLSKSVQLLEHFPTGMVTSRPFRTNPDYYTSVAWAEATPELRSSAAVIPDEFWPI